MDNFCTLEKDLACHLEKDLNFEKTIHKRRSSVFQSRAIIFNECEENEKSIDTNDIVQCASKVSQDETFNLEEYIIHLRNERKEWIETLKQRKTQRRNLAKQKLSLECQEQLLDLNDLMEHEKVFVTARPNYQYICENYKKLSDITAKISILHKLVYELNQRFILQMEGRVHKITDKIIEVSGS